MTNLGFRLAMESHGIGVRETDVGDRHVLAALDADGLALGGEQSGHIIFRTRSTTGDGILTGIALADLMRRSGRSLADLAHGLVERVPQVLVNVPIPQPERLADCAEVWEAVAKAEVELGHEGRVLLRPSGTEPLVRVMVEARSEAQADDGGGPAGRGRGGRARPSRGLAPPGHRRGPRVAWGDVRDHWRHRRARRPPRDPGRPAQARVPGLRLGRGGAGGRRGDLAGPGRRRHPLGGRTGGAHRATGPGPPGTSAGIGHTRWATHGHPTVDNAHPHLDCTGRLAVIHNGIIENHAALRTDLVAGGHTMRSATDTEVVAHLIEDHMARRTAARRGDPRRARRRPGRLLHRRRARGRARHDRGGAPLHPARPRAARRCRLAGLGHPGAARAGRPALRPGRRRAGRPHPGRHRGHHPGRRPGHPRGAAHHLGSRGGPEGRLRGLHVQGDARAAPGGGQHAARPPRCRRPPGARRNAAEPRRPAPGRQGVHRGLRQQLPRRPGGQVRH